MAKEHGMKTVAAVLTAMGLGAGAALATMPPQPGEDVDPRFTAQSWGMAGSSCAAGSDIVDFAMGPGGFWFRRDGTAGGPWSYTQVSLAKGDAGALATVDETGLGQTRDVWRIQPDGSLRLWSRVVLTPEEAGSGEGKGTVFVKDGLGMIGEDGEALETGVPTLAYEPCEGRAATFGPGVAEALDGVWGAVRGDAICARGDWALTLRLADPVATMEIARYGAEGDSYGEGESLSFVYRADAEEKTATLVYGGAFDANEMALSLLPEGRLGMTHQDENLTLARCP
jgi:hypothetical protein